VERQVLTMFIDEMPPQFDNLVQSLINLGLLLPLSQEEALPKCMEAAYRIALTVAGKLQFPGTTLVE
jgi:hypothetical protein